MFQLLPRKRSFRKKDKYFKVSFKLSLKTNNYSLYFLIYICHDDSVTGGQACTICPPLLGELKHLILMTVPTCREAGVPLCRWDTEPTMLETENQLITARIIRKPSISTTQLPSQRWKEMGQLQCRLRPQEQGSEGSLSQSPRWWWEWFLH